jgi:predicted amidohydrolase YtcJ
MSAPAALLIRNAAVYGRPRGTRHDVLIADGRIQAVTPAGSPRIGELSGLAGQVQSPSGPRAEPTSFPNGIPVTAEADIDARGGALLPGLTDHHIHLYATAADDVSVQCGPPAVRTPAELAHALRSARPGADGWIRAVGYHESVAGDLDAPALDAIRADLPIRVQHRSGALWILNSRALQALHRTGDGRLFRADGLLRGLAAAPPSLARLGRRLAAHGITAVTDATPNLPPDTIAALAGARASGDLPQRTSLLGAPPEPLPPGLTAGPWKIVLADSELPDFDRLTAEIARTHSAGRPVAVHTVTRESTALLLAALRVTGTHPGDRIEHGSLLPAEILPELAAAGLRVVTQPGFLADRGDDYLRDVPAEDHRDLYRARSLLRAGVRVALSSDAPYGPLDPWANIRAATDRRSSTGRLINPAERLTPHQALDAYLTPAARPGDRPPTPRPGSPADLVVLDRPPTDAGTPAVAHTLIAGVPVHGTLTGRTDSSHPRVPGWDA